MSRIAGRVFCHMTWYLMRRLISYHRVAHRQAKLSHASSVHLTSDITCQKICKYFNLFVIDRVHGMKGRYLEYALLQFIWTKCVWDLDAFANRIGCNCSNIWYFAQEAQNCIVICKTLNCKKVFAKMHNCIYFHLLSFEAYIQTGVHFSLDVLPSWADWGSCAHKCVC